MSLIMRNRLLYAGLLAYLCLGLVGCGAEAPAPPAEDVVIRDVATLIETVPANGTDAAEQLPIVLYFDKEPLAVTVNGSAARVQENKAIWCFPNSSPQGDQLFHIEWTNPDGSSHAGAFIRLSVATVDFVEMAIVTSSVLEGERNLDADLLNREGIWFELNVPVIARKAKLLAADGRDLGWKTVWDDLTLTFRPGANGQALENGRSYRIEMVFFNPSWQRGHACDCGADCSRLKNYEVTISFVTN